MTRRFNYTGRERLTGNEFYAKTISEDPLLASLKLDLSQTAYAPSASVFIEAYSGTITKRIDCGTVANLNAPKQVDLTSLQTGGSILFRIKIVNPEDGLILASGDRLRLVGEDEELNRKPLLSVRVDDTLGEEIWRLDVSANTSPVLILNSKVPSLKNRLLEDPLIGGTILLPAVRKVLEVLLEDLDGADWQSDWVKFAKNVYPDIDIDQTIPEADRDMWIDDFIKYFAASHNFASKCKAAAEGEQA